jgi:hypothetical protein
MIIKKGKDIMLTVDKINNLEYNNNILVDTIIKMQEVLIEGYNNGTPWTAIDKCLKLLNKLEKEYKG